jgi:Kef-type K+ transport system membrane component KefB
MDGAWLARARWRWRGAWLWPAFVITAVLDGAIARARPFAGDSQGFLGGMLAGLIINLVVVVCCSGVLAKMLRRRRTDVPVAVARNYGGTFAVVTVSVLLAAIGLGRHSGIVARQRALSDAIVRAAAFIGDHAPATFRVDATRTDTFTIQAGEIYRTCVSSQDGRRAYCVIVKPRLPLAQSVVFAGSEPNWLFAEGAN